VTHWATCIRSLALLLGALAVALALASVTAAEGMLGVLTPRQEAALEPSFEGQLAEVHVRIGDVVEQGALIASLDDEPIRRALEEAEARLEQAQAERAAATTRLRMADGNLERQNTLLTRQAVSREMVREAEREVDLARAERDQSRAVVKQFEAAVAEQRARLRQTQIRAPFAGTIAERYGRFGMTVGPDRPVARLISDQMLWARFAAPVTDAGRLKLDRKLKILVVGLGQELTGHIRQIGSEVDPASGMIICEADVEWPVDWGGPPLAGQTVRVWFDS
jgi:RND family efflux transporter MFP subunit